MQSYSFSKCVGGGSVGGGLPEAFGVCVGGGGSVGGGGTWGVRYSFR